MRFYQSVFGGKLTMQAIESRSAGKDASTGQSNILHLMLITENGLVLNATGTPGATDQVLATNPIAVNIDQEDQLQRIWGKLSETGTVVVPLRATPESGTFGICVDQYGVEWLVGIRKCRQDSFRIELKSSGPSLLFEQKGPDGEGRLSRIRPDVADTNSPNPIMSITWLGLRKKRP